MVNIKFLFLRVQRKSFTACHSGKLKLAYTSPDVISTSPKNFLILTRRIDFTVLLLYEFLKKLHLPVGQVKHRIHQPNSKIHQPRLSATAFFARCFLLIYFPTLKEKFCIPEQPRTCNILCIDSLLLNNNMHNQMVKSESKISK